MGLYVQHLLAVPSNPATAAFPATMPSYEIRTTATLGRPKLMEFVAQPLTSVQVNRIVLGYATPGRGPSVPFVAENPDDGPTSVVGATFWGTTPVETSGNLIRRATSNGFRGVLWIFPQGIVITSSRSVVLSQDNGSPSVSVYAQVEE